MAEKITSGPLTTTYIPPAGGTSSSTAPEIINSGTTNQPYVSSSAPVVNAEKNVTNMVSGLTAPDIGEQSAFKASQSYVSQLDKQIAELDRQAIGKGQLINQQFDIAERELKQGQEQETGAYRTTLARIGGYLGDSASGTGALLKLAQDHRSEITALAAKRAAAIQAAQDAANDKKYNLALKKAEEAKSLEKEIYDRKNNYLDQTIKTRQENRAAFEGDTKRAAAYAPAITDSIKDLDEMGAEDYINKTAKNIGIDPQILASEVTKYRTEKNKEIQATILDMVRDYPSAGITMQDINGGDIGLILDKVTLSDDYIRKSEYEKAQTNKILADIVASSSGPEAATIDAFAETWATTGKKPTSMPKGAEGVIYERAKQIARESLPDGQIINSLTGLAAGNLGAEEAKAYAASWSILQQLPLMRDFVEQTEGQSPIGAGGKVNYWVNEKLGLLPEDLKRFQDTMDNIAGQLLLARSGQAVSEQEYKRVRALLPSSDKWQKYNKADLEAFEQVFRDALTNSLRTKGLEMKGFSPMTDGDIESEFDGGEKKNDPVSGDIGSKLRLAIAARETGSRGYQTVSDKPTVREGGRKDWAYGKYQVMGDNIPSWTQQYLGKRMSIQEFLNNPRAQDQLAEARMTELYKKYGNVKDVAAVWFSGRPLAVSKNNKDAFGTTVSSYVNDVARHFASLG